MESRRWRMSDLRERTVEIWQGVRVGSCSRSFFWEKKKIYSSSFQFSTCCVDIEGKQRKGSTPRMPRKVKTGSTARATANKTHLILRMAWKNILLEALGWWKRIKNSFKPPTTPLWNKENYILLFFFSFFLNQWLCSPKETSLRQQCWITGLGKLFIGGVGWLWFFYRFNVAFFLIHFSTVPSCHVIFAGYISIVWLCRPSFCFCFFVFRFRFFLPLIKEQIFSKQRKEKYIHHIY